MRLYYISQRFQLMSYSFLFKYIVIGDTSVGKSCILMQFIDKVFKVDSDPTIGVEFGSKTILLQNKKIKLQIWDTAGQEAYKSITRSYYRSTVGAILVYDISSRHTFEGLAKWQDQIKQHATNQNLVVLLLGNKADLSSSREVSSQEGQEFAAKHGMKFMECSAKTGKNIELAFETISQTVIQAIEDQRINPYLESGGVKIGQLQPLRAEEGPRRCC